MTILKQTLLFLCVFTITIAVSQEEIKEKDISQVNISDLIKEVQIIKKDGDNFKMVWWIPNEYWRVAIQGTSVASSGYVDQVFDAFEGYILIGTLHTEINAFGGMKPKPTKIQLKDKKGNIYDAVDENELPSEYSKMLATLKPSMASTMGDFGKQMKFHVFKETGKNGKLIASATGTGEFTVLFNKENKFTYKLPLACLVEEKVCPTDGELLNANWIFCPWHGKKLKLQTK
ncbi:hypothetical protein [Kordia sp.]|uniref:hypothetical protein n=1 Tax=Kordia sp. TaxID=1965332 RepID=UPI003D6AF4DD